MILTEDQAEAFRRAKEATSHPFGSYTENKFFVIDGYAGTGKSTLIPKLVETVIKPAHVLAPTNKALLVVDTKLKEYENELDYSKSTLHSLLYGQPDDDMNWIPSEEKIRGKVVIIDESSMVNLAVFNDLVSKYQNSYIIFVGDSFQLEPIGEPTAIFTNLPRFTLTEVVRYDSSILSVANRLRSTMRPIVKIEGDVEYESQRLGALTRFATDLAYGKDSVLITATNEARVSYNEAIRKALNKPKLVENDTLMAVTNTGRYANGEVFKASGKGYLFTKTYKIKDVDLEIQAYQNKGERFLVIPKLPWAALTAYEIFKHLTIGEAIDLFGEDNVIIAAKKVRNVTICTWGYSISCHKCVDENTWILTSQGFCKIKDYQRQQVFNGKFLEAPSLFIDSGVEETITMKTHNGYELSATKDHSQIVLDDQGNQVRKLVKDIVEGDIVLVAKGSSIFGNNLSVFKGAKCIPNKLTKELAEWLGLFVADGCLYKKNKGFRFLKRHKDVVERFAYLTNFLFGINKEVVPDKYSNSWKIEVNNVELGKELNEYIPDLRPHQKFIPKEILAAPKRMQCAFLKGFAEDGDVSKKDGAITFTMNDKQLSILLQQMLLNLGIVSQRGFYYGNYRVTLYSSNITIFKNNIGFVSSFKNSRVKKVKRHRDSKSFKSLHYLVTQSNIDRGGLLARSWQGLQSVNKCTMHTAKLYIESTKDFDKDKLYKTLDDLLNNYSLEIVKQVSLNEPSQTYCFTMPETHQFLQNGIVSGNCQGSQFENVYVDFNYCSPVWNPNRWLYTAITRASKKVILLPTKNIDFE